MLNGHLEMPKLTVIKSWPHTDRPMQFLQTTEITHDIVLESFVSQEITNVCHCLSLTADKISLMAHWNL